MSSTVSNGGSSRGRRILSAIMFTDVVGFSARMGQNETLTGALVQRDLEFMARRCEARRGRVVKTTGDGLLVVFDSAVEAVSAAIAIQQAIGDAGKRLPKDQVLTHRIAVHLGDIILTADNDVMGEGVNIAARLQELADPGGICISAATYELVKNRLKLEGVYVGPCELKNINEPVGVYRLGVDGKSASLGGSGSAGSPTVGKRWALKGKQWWWRGGVGVAVIAVFAVLGLMLMLSGGGVSAERVERQVDTTAPAPNDERDADVSAAPPIADALPANADVFMARAHFVRRNDFAGLASHLLANPDLVPDASRRKDALQRYARLAAGQANVMARLREHSSESPLKIVNADGDASDDWEAWADDVERIHIRDGDGERHYPLHEVENVRFFQIAVTMVANDVAKARKPAGKEVVELLKTLMKEYGIAESALGDLLPPGVPMPR